MREPSRTERLPKYRSEYAGTKLAAAEGMARAVTFPLPRASHVRRWSCDTPVHGGTTAHGGLELAWLDAGSACYRSSDGVVSAVPGTCVVVPPGVEHATSLDMHVRATVIELDAATLREVSAVTRLSHRRIERLQCTRDDEGLGALGALVAREAASRAPDAALVVDALVEALIVKLFRLAADDRRPEKARDPRLLAAVDYAHAHLTDASLSVSGMALAAGMSRYHFSRTFRSALGVSPHAYVLELRARHAGSLLRRRDRSVTDAAFSAGFRDLGRFRAAFRRVFGVSPSSYAGAVRRPREAELGARSGSLAS